MDDRLQDRAKGQSGKLQNESRSGISPGSVAAGDGLHFPAAIYNRIDELDDYGEEYRIFEPLGNIVTADMRHHQQRRRRKAAADQPADKAVLARSGLAEIEATVAAVNPEPFLSVVSKGHTLIIDTDIARGIDLGTMLHARQLPCTLLVVNSRATATTVSRAGPLLLLEARDVSVAGGFGGFTATVQGNDGQRDLHEYLDGKPACFDLVLDLQDRPAFAGDRLPLGYYAPGPDPGSLRKAMAELPELRGRFTKPRFTVFHQSRCLHGRSRLRDCTRCLDICPVGAIRSADGQIRIDPYLCQGCGGCALVCPADAVRLVHPGQQELLDRLRLELGSREPLSGSPLTLIIYDQESDQDKENMMAGRRDAHWLSFRVEEIGHVSLAFLLASMAYGAARVIVVCSPQNPGPIRRAVEWQTRMATAILQGIGMAGDMVCFVEAPLDCEAFPGEALKAAGDYCPVGNPVTTGGPATFAAGEEQRSLVRKAVQHLFDHAAGARTEILMPAGSPFGAVTIDPTACTLCMACAGACPAAALSAGGETPRLSFMESRCHQCGLCAEVCPEGAIHLQARLLCDPEAVESPAVLREAAPFRCVECGEAFAAEAMINRIREQLKGHWMYSSDRQMRRLQMCRTCRTRDALLSKDMKLWSR